MSEEKTEQQIEQERIEKEERENFLTIRESSGGRVMYRITEEELESALLNCFTMMRHVQEFVSKHGFRMTFSTITSAEEGEFARHMREFSLNNNPNDAMFELEIQQQRLARHLCHMYFPSGEQYNFAQLAPEERLKTLMEFPGPVQQTLYSHYYIFSEILRRAVTDNGTLKN